MVERHKRGRSREDQAMPTPRRFPHARWTLALLTGAAIVALAVTAAAGRTPPRPAPGPVRAPRAVAVPAPAPVRVLRAPRRLRAPRVVAVPAPAPVRVLRAPRAVAAPARVRALRAGAVPVPVPASTLLAPPAVAVPSVVIAGGALYAAPVPLAPCRRSATTPPATAPSAALANSFGILRRPAAAADALPAEALAALKLRGLRPEGTGSARLLRSGPGAGRAWVVPVSDADPAAACLPARRPSTGAATDREGLAVVALGGAPYGGGGTRVDLVRGTAPVTIEPCAGPDHRSLEVSGIVPDGVAAAYLTGQDGTAVRADVKDNGFALLIPTPNSAQQRYVVWSGADGVPHVQPTLVSALPLVACRGAALPGARVSPDRFQCSANAGYAVAITPARRSKRPNHFLRTVPALPAISRCAAPTIRLLTSTRVHVRTRPRKHR